MSSGQNLGPSLTLPLTPHILSVSKSCSSAFTCPESSLIGHTTGTPVPAAQVPQPGFPTCALQSSLGRYSNLLKTQVRAPQNRPQTSHLTLLLPPRPDTLALLVPPLSPHLPLFLLTCYAQLSRADGPEAPRVCSSLRLLP